MVRPRKTTGHGSVTNWAQDSTHLCWVDMATWLRSKVSIFFRVFETVQLWKIDYTLGIEHAVVVIYTFEAMSYDWFPTAQGLEALPQKNPTGDGAFRGSRHHQCHFLCIYIYIYPIQIIQIIPFLMKNPVFIASFLLVVLTYGISKFGSLNPPK